MKEKSIYRYEKLFDKISKPLSQKKKKWKVTFKKQKHFPQTNRKQHTS
jgi:hypothetical protein